MRRPVLSLLTFLPLGLLAALDPLEMRWTFGAHEPFAMYRRVGRKCTGGVDGNARWLKDWFAWWDTRAPSVMRELGLNWVHSRFYKGMGWTFERKDFPNVRRFVANCHSNDVHVLAYVQFSTLYPEFMKAEFPEVDTWGQVDENGQPRHYHDGSYFRLMPCLNCRDWEEHLKRVATIAVTEGGFDGVMFDNAFSYPCYCARCEATFSDYLQGLPDKAERFGADDLSQMRLPRPVESAVNGEVRDPVVQAWIRWRTDTTTAVLRRLRDHVKSVRPDAVVSGNAQPFHRATGASLFGVDMVDLAGVFDLVIGQSANYPTVKDGQIVSRVRDLKLARELGVPIVALCDSDSQMTPEQERYYLLPLYEDLVFGGVPTDRTVMNPTPVPGFLDAARLARRRPQLAALTARVRRERERFAAPVCAPVRLLYPTKELPLSRQSHAALVAAEEILTRRHVPWGFLVSTPERPFVVPKGMEVLVVAGQLALSDAQRAGIVAWARAGGKVVVTGDAGRYDELNAQHLANPLKAELAGCTGVVWVDEADRVAPCVLDWSYAIGAPADHGDRLVAALAACGWTPPLAFEGLPETTAVDVRRTASGDLIVHFVNYEPDRPVRDARVRLPRGETVAMPDLVEYASVCLPAGSKSVDFSCPKER